MGCPMGLGESYESEGALGEFCEARSGLYGRSIGPVVRGGNYEGPIGKYLEVPWGCTWVL